jgi:outer membrane lipoprotein-sorting protein
MIRLLNIVFISSLLILFSGLAGAEKENENIKEIISKLDRLYRADQSYARIEMEIVNPNWARTLRMDCWTKGMTKTFIRVLSPEKDRGFSTLRIEKEMWNYFPKIAKVMKVPPSMMMGSWMGSDFTNDDLVKQTTLLDDYDASLLENSNPETDFYHIQLIPKKLTTTVWGKITAKIRKKDYIPVSEEYYDEKGSLARRMEFSDIKDLGGRMVPSTMVVIPVTKSGNKTVIRYLSADFSPGVEEGIFTLRNLQKKI